MRIKIRRGLDIPISGVPDQRIAEANDVGWVGVVASDYVGLRARVVVDVGDEVRVGQTLFHDERTPEVRFTSPGAGEVVAIHRGSRRSLQTVVVRLDGDQAERFPTYDRDELSRLDRDAVRSQLLEAGLWPALRARPFGVIPAPESTPHSIFVTAIDTNPLAADPSVVIREREDAFHDGVAVLSRLTEGSVYVCRARDAKPPLPRLDSVTAVEVAGPHPAGLPGTHIHFVDPVSRHKTVWHLHYQDVIAIGVLFVTGTLETERIISVAGPAVRRPRLVRTRLGASTEDLLRNELDDADCRVISGSILSGRRAAGHARYLGPRDLQVSALREDPSRHFLDWLAPGFGKYSAIRAFLSSLRSKRHRYPLTTSQHGSPRAMVPIGNFEKVMPLGVLPAPLLKALIVRDAESAEALGCLELDEEDLALCSFVCCSKYEYGGFLRETLDAIRSEE